MPARRPTGTVTFLLTDLEGSTAQWQRAGEAFTTALASHHLLLRRTFLRFGGCEVNETGDGFLVAFERAGDALACAVASQRALADSPSPKEAGPLRVRMALHTGDVELQEGEYRGLVLHHASRMLAAAHGGQILCSEATAIVARRNLEPGIRLTDLGVYRLRDVEAPERLFRVEYLDMAQRVFPPLHAEAGYARNLPLQFTRFIGREKELEQLQELLLAEPTRLVTMTGSGGTGKSRLALELASAVIERFSGAVWFVPLADLSDPHRILDAVLDALRLPRSPSMEPFEQVVETFSRQPSLLVLDNFEQLVEEGAPVVRTLLERVPSLKCLVTSRQRLDLSGEREFLVPPLQTPAGGLGTGPHSAPSAPPAPEQLSMYESVQLFIDRAQAVKPDFQVTNQNAAALAEVCNRLEGIPLAIELAAARAQVLTPSQMLHQLAHRFEFLVSRKRDGVKRHQTLHAAVDWSYRLLPPELQRFFARLSVFRGGWSLEAAEAVCQEPLALDYLAQLRECSLVLSEDAGEETRFRMLETLREYAAEQLDASGVTETVRRQHAGFFLTLSEGRPTAIMGAEPEWWLERLEQEHDNVRAALAWGQVAPDGGETALRLAGAMGWFWRARGYWTEGREWLEALLERVGPSARTAARVTALVGAGNLAWLQGEYERGAKLGEESLALARELADQGAIIGSLHLLGRVAWRQGEYERAARLGEESLALSQKLKDKGGIGTSLRLLARAALSQGEYERAAALGEESLVLARELGRKWDTGVSLHLLAHVAQRQGEYVRAARLSHESLTLARELGNKGDIANSLRLLGRVAWRQGEYERAARLGEESLALSEELKDKGGIAHSLHHLGEVAQSQGHHHDAMSRHRQSLAVFQELCKIGSVDAKLGIAACLASLSTCAGDQGQPVQAARLCGAAQALRDSLRTPLAPADRADYEREVAAARSRLGEEAFAVAWAEGHAMTLEQATAYALDERDKA